MKKRTKVGEWKTVFKGEFFQIEQAPAVFSSGKKITFERAWRPASVIVLAFNEKKELILTREFRSKSGKYEWMLPAGKADGGGTPLSDARRELQEETGFKAKNIKLFHKSDSSTILNWVHYTFIASGLTYEPIETHEDEDITVISMSLEKAYNMVIEGKILNDWIAYMISRAYWEKEKIFKILKI